MDGSKCILQVRGVRPFLSDKYDIEKHPNYKYLADFNSDFNFNITDFVNAFKEDRAKLLEGVNKKNTKHVVIEINEDEDEDTADAAADTNTVETAPAPTPEPETVSNTEVLPTEPASEPAETTEPTNQDNKNDNPYNEEDEDDTDDFDPNDTEIV